MTLTQLLDNARQLQQGIQQGTIVREVLQPHGNDIVDLQRTQLLMGKASDGKDLRPYYTEDLKPSGYFRSRTSAEKYKAWKQQLSYPKNVERNPNAPNLYITGLFHNDLNVSFGTDTLAVVPDTAYAANIMRKYGLNVFGLNAASWSELWDTMGVKNELLEKMKNVLWQ